MYLIFVYNSWVITPEVLGISQVMRMIKVSLIMQMR